MTDRSSKTPHRTRTSLRAFRLFSHSLTRIHVLSVSLFVLYELRKGQRERGEKGTSLIDP